MGAISEYGAGRIAKLARDGSGRIVAEPRVDGAGGIDPDGAPVPAVHESAVATRAPVSTSRRTLTSGVVDAPGSMRRMIGAKTAAARTEDPLSQETYGSLTGSTRRPGTFRRSVRELGEQPRFDV